jgi:hypothetical protein
MKSLLNIDKSSGRITLSDGVVVFDPNVGLGAARLNSARVLFEATAEDEVKVSVSYVEINGGFLSFFAHHSKFGSSWDDWTEQKERSRVGWLAEFLKSCGAPVGSYPWGKVEALYDAKGGQGLAMVSYAAQQTAARDRVKKRGA